MTDREYLQYLHDVLHGFLGSKVNLVLEGNHVDPKDDLNDAMNIIANLLRDIEEYLDEHN